MPAATVAPSALGAGLLGGAGGALAAVVIAATRVPYVVAVSADLLTVVRCRRLRPSRLLRIETSVERGELSLVERGDSRVEIASSRYWVRGAALDEARKAVLPGGRA